MKRGRANNQPFSILILLIIFTQCLNFELIEEGQLQDMQMQDWKHRHPTKFITRQFGNETKLITHVKPGDNADMDWKIVLPEEHIKPVIKWFHQVLGHPG